MIVWVLGLPSELSRSWGASQAGKKLQVSAAFWYIGKEEPNLDHSIGEE